MVTALSLLTFISCKKAQTEKVDSFPDGALVEATFVKKNECNGSAKDAIVCEKFHQNDGWIRVDEIRR